jgi:mono/diheme cytochrome c family protein
MGRKSLLAVVGVALAAAAWFVEVPWRWRMSDAELVEAARRGRQVFLTNCATCHGGEQGPPGQMELKQDYSQREIGRALSAPPQGMPPFSGTDEQRRDLIVFLTEG